MKKIIRLSTFLILASCSSEDSYFSTAVEQDTVDITSVVEANFKNDYTHGVNVVVNGDYISISSTGLPNHKTPYWGEEHKMYEKFSGINHANANSSMATFNYVMTIPAYPAEANNKEQIELGPVGMALNGVPLYSDYEVDGLLTEDDWSTFDAFGGHSGPNGDYHYHCEGEYPKADNANLIGFLRDGFPIYGRKDIDGSYPDDLDENGGHIGLTPDFSEAIYHYHVSNEAYATSGLYVIKSGGYHGTKGTFSH